MDAVTLGELAGVIAAPTSNLCANDSFSAVSTDSRQLNPGDVFWALNGPKHDGHDYVREAVSAGARAVVVGRPVQSECPALLVPDVAQALSQFAAWYRATLPATIVGITGSVGKTTCRTLIHDVLAARRNVGQSPANFNNSLGVPLSLLQASAGDDYFIVELGASAVGEVAKLAALAVPEIGVVTAICEAHLEGFGSLEDVQQGKGELIEALPACGTAFLNGDDPLVRALADRASCEVRFFGASDECDVRAVGVVVEPERLSFTVDGFTYEVGVAGRHHMGNVLAAVAVGREAGLLPPEIQLGLSTYVPPTGRCNVQRIGESVLIDDSYNASPRSVVAASELLQRFEPTGRRILVLGDMAELGAEAGRLHRETGRDCASPGGIDLVLAVGVFAHETVTGAASAGTPAGAFTDITELSSELTNTVQPGDVVLVKGSRAAKMERIVSGLAKQFHSSTENRSVA